MTSPLATRVAMISPRYSPDIGGVEQNAERIARGLVERGVRVDLLTTDPTKRLPRREVLDGVDVRRFPTVAGDGVYFVSPRLARWLYHHAADYDLLHVHSYHTALGLEVASIARMAGVPLVVTAHYHGTGHTPLRRVIHVVYRPFGQWMLRSADAVIANSTAEADLVRSDAGADLPVTVVPPGIDTGDGEEAEQIDRASDRRYVLTVGRLEPYKQTSRIVETLAALPDEYELVVIGRGPAQDAVQATAARLGVERRVRLLGSVARPTLLGWYRAADLLVTLSRHEAFGLVLGEAASAGTPVVASDIPAHREVAAYLPPGRVTLVSPDCPPAELAPVLARTAALGRNDPQDASIPTWDATVTGVLAVYRSILEAPAEGDGRHRGP